MLVGLELSTDGQFGADSAVGLPQGLPPTLRGLGVPAAARFPSQPASRASCGASELGAQGLSLCHEGAEIYNRAGVKGCCSRDLY